MRKTFIWIGKKLKRYFGQTVKEVVAFVICLGCAGLWVIIIYFLAGYTVLGIDYLPQTETTKEFLNVLPGAFSNQWQALTTDWFFHEKLGLGVALKWGVWFLAKFMKAVFLKTF